MLEKIPGIIFKDPCKRCLVRARCSHLPIFSRPVCEVKNYWRSNTNKLYSIIMKINDTGVLLSFIIVCLILVVTFILGIWKWIDLFILYL